MKEGFLRCRKKFVLDIVYKIGYILLQDQELFLVKGLALNGPAPLLFQDNHVMGQTSDDKTRRMERFLRALAGTGNISASVRESGLSRSTVYFWRAHDHEFAKNWDDALAEATDKLAYEARRRALDGIEVVQYFQGEPVGTIRKYSDQLLMFLLRAYRPSIYKPGSRRGPDQVCDASQARKSLLRKMATFDKGDDDE